MKAPFLALMILATPAAAQDLSQEIGANGITPTLARLKAQPEPALEDIFAIGGLHFLGAVERALQLQWRTGADQVTGNAGDTLGLPFLRLPVPPNPTPEPFNGALITRLFADIDADMAAARTALAILPEGEPFGLDLTFSDLWFDVNQNGAREAEEDALTILGPQLLGWQWQAPDPATPPLTVRFDAADAAWLTAYTHVMSGVANTILAYDPAASIDRVIASRAALKVAQPSSDDFNFDASFGQFLDAFAMLEGAVNQQPDASRAKAAKEHFLAMITENRRFWTLVAQETDNDREWVPNDKQTSALGFTLPPGTGDTWLGVLADGEALLQGRLLLPYWRGPEGQGINLGRMFDDPAPMSVTGWFQGWAAVPYLQQGPVVDATSLRQFEALMGGDAGLMMVFLN
ncbi:hypothetical protein [Tabrizicola sp.]|uniref:hypothetical protein n=1 Tax=Tabrizicola sp. TaxID=2005166 RepID=UPI0027345AC0|nr:hypothetical protein [Tabrizicola sp.]MDP3195225.1 hypothetical protein [Tabrizicola sp.]MDZ4088885.1 hypothetical protein [Tabrizicola sp.]